MCKFSSKSGGVPFQISFFWGDLTRNDPIEISEATLGTSVRCFSNYLKTQFVRSYSNLCNINDCFVCNNLN